MRAWMQDVDEDSVALVHGVSGEDLDTIATYCREASGDKQASDFKHAARVDGAVIMAWCNKRGIPWDKFFRDDKLVNEFLNDQENAAFRIWKGRC